MTTVQPYCDVITKRMRTCLIELSVTLMLVTALQGVDYGQSSSRSKSSFAEVVRAVNAAHRVNSFRSKHYKNSIHFSAAERNVDSLHPLAESLVSHSHNNVLGDESLAASEKTGLNSVMSGPVSEHQLCRVPCKCSKDPPLCKTPYTVKDGCDCCRVCPRQQGDLCNVRDRCDERRGLFCDTSDSGGGGSGDSGGEGLQRGLCRAKSGKDCHFGGKTYKDGAEFKPNCSQLCSCQNGIYACASLCPQEERMPSSGGMCRDAQLVSVGSRCCREWVCPHAHNLPRPEDDDFTNAVSRNVLPAASSISKSTHAENCVRENTGWSPCSVTCGIGISVRVSNDNDDCESIRERRLCLIRPCSLDDKQFLGKDCKNTWRHVATVALRITFDGCTSVKEFRPKYCSTCKRRRCCRPDSTDTRRIDMTCPDGKIVTEKLMWVKSCRCSESNCK